MSTVLWGHFVCLEPDLASFFLLKEKFFSYLKKKKVHECVRVKLTGKGQIGVGMEETGSFTTDQVNVDPESYKKLL